MIHELLDHVEKLPIYLADKENWQSLMIDKFPPVIWRLSYKLSETRTLLLHKLHHTGSELALMHSHSWPFACLVVDGGYEHGIGWGVSRNVAPMASYTEYIKSGDVYEILDSCIWHYTKPVAYDTSWSVMLIGPRNRPRRAQNNSPLSTEQREEIFSYFNWYCKYGEMEYPYK